MNITLLVGLALALGACSRDPIELVEGYCPGAEADRCYFESQRADGF
jgi:hypothetical protein